MRPPPASGWRTKRKATDLTKAPDDGLNIISPAMSMVKLTLEDTTKRDAANSAPPPIMSALRFHTSPRMPSATPATLPHILGTLSGRPTCT